jgi:fermentation-respiration switch protein FrsA (DUF1100 family)
VYQKEMGNSISNLVFQPPEISYLASLTIFQISENCSAFYIKKSKAKFTILFSHANAEDIGNLYDQFKVLSNNLNVNILCYDYEGYGKSFGKQPTEALCYENIESAYQYLINHLKILPKNIILYGKSLGTGPTCWLAEKLCVSDTRIGGVMLQSPILSIYRVAFNFRFTLPGDMFANVDRIKSINCPLMIIHGTKDEVVPFWNSEILFINSLIQWRGKPLWVDQAGHNNIESTLQNEFYIKIREFFFEWIPEYEYIVN